MLVYINIVNVTYLWGFLCVLTDIKTPTKQAKNPPKQLKPQPTKKTPTNQQKNPESNRNFTPNPRCPHTTTAKSPAD